MSEFERAEAYEESYRQTFAEIDALRENGSYDEASEIEESITGDLEMEHRADLFLGCVETLDYLRAYFILTEDGYEIEKCVLHQVTYNRMKEVKETVVLRDSALWRLMDEHLAQLH